MSSVKARFNVSAPRPYTTRDGEEKKQWINVCRATQWDDGNISIELHAVPVGNWFDGKLMLFPEDRDGQKKPEGRAPRQRQAPSNDSDPDDDLPF